MEANLQLMCDPSARMRRTMQLATPQEISSSVPINRYYRSLNELFRVAGVNENDYEKAFIYYMRFVSLAIEELPKHKQYEGFSSLEKTKAEASLTEAFSKAELLKSLLKKKYEEDAVWAKRELERKPEVRVPPVQNKQSTEAHLNLQNNHKKVITASGSNSRNSIFDHVPRNEVIVSGDLIEKFVQLAQYNIDRNVETCGILCGHPVSGGAYRITHTVVPKQTGAPDKCDTRNEEEVFAYQDANNLITLGWIHTHPSQTAFLSSVDLHTHCSYQLMLPEAVAIVVAPKFNEVGVFRLTEQGMKEISECRQTGFHPHENTASLFYYCHDVQFRTDSTMATVIDLRQNA